MLSGMSKGSRLSRSGKSGPSGKSGRSGGGGPQGGVSAAEQRGPLLATSTSAHAGGKKDSLVSNASQINLNTQNNTQALNAQSTHTMNMQ